MMMNNYTDISLNKIPNQIDLKLQSYQDSLNDTAEWKAKAQPKIPNPAEFIEIHAKSLEDLKKRWEDWKTNKPNATETISTYEAKLKQCDSYISLMAEVLLEKYHSSAMPQQDLREKSIKVEVDKAPTLVKDSTTLQSDPKAPWEMLQWAVENESPQNLQQIFDVFLGDPQRFLELRDEQNYLRGFPFYECACVSYGRTSRNNRQKAEKLIVEDIEANIKKRSEFVRLESFGAGGILQDLIIVGKLIQRGFKNISILFVDKKPESELAIQFEKFLNKLPNVSIKAIYSPFISTKREFDAIYSIDLEELNQSNGDCWMEVFHAKEALTKNGKFYLFGDNQQLILQKDNNFIDLKGIAEAAVEQLSLHAQFSVLEQVNEINMLVTKDKLKPNFHYQVIAKLIQFLSHKFNKPINVHLYSNEKNTTRQLNGWAVGMVLKRLSGATQLNVNYYEQSFNVEQKKNTSKVAQIHVNELLDGNVIIEIEKF